MFDLVTGRSVHLAHGSTAPAIITAAIHLTATSAVLILPVMFATRALPKIPTMSVFVAAMASPPPPPPPAPPVGRAQPAPEASSSPNPHAAPIEAPAVIETEVPEYLDDGEEGVEGGVEGGLPGGIAGGIVGGIVLAPPPPPPPPPPEPPAPAKPVRVGGEIRPPALLRRVEPEYPDLAVRAHVEGIVILEAIIDEAGAVGSIKVLRSVPLLDRAAIRAVEQWQYSPVVLNGRPVPVILTVALSFTIPKG